MVGYLLGDMLRYAIASAVMLASTCSSASARRAGFRASSPGWRC